jgi:hypothetical protein
VVLAFFTLCAVVFAKMYLFCFLPLWAWTRQNHSDSFFYIILHNVKCFSNLKTGSVLMWKWNVIK